MENAVTHKTYPQFSITLNGKVYSKNGRQIKANEFITINGLIDENGIRGKTKRIPFNRFVWEGLNGPVPHGCTVKGSRLVNKNKIIVDVTNLDTAKCTQYTFYSVSEASKKLNLDYHLIRRRINYISKKPSGCKTSNLVTTNNHLYEFKGAESSLETPEACPKGLSKASFKGPSG